MEESGKLEGRLGGVIETGGVVCTLARLDWKSPGREIGRGGGWSLS